MNTSDQINSTAAAVAAPEVSKIADLVRLSEAQDADKLDFTGKASVDFTFDEQARMITPRALFQAEAQHCDLTEWALRQTLARLGLAVFGSGTGKGLPADYFLAIPPDLRAFLLNRHMTDLRGKNGKGEWFVRTYKNRVRAVLSNTYAALQNTELLQLFHDVIAQQRTTDLKLSQSTVSPDTLHVRTVWRYVDTDGRGGGSAAPAPWGLGVYIGNGEIGNSKTRVLPLIKRTSCDNSIIIEHDKGVEFTHRGSHAAKMVLLKSAVAEVFPVAAEMLDRMIEAEAETVPDFADVLEGLSRKYGWSDQLKTTVTLGTEGAQTRAGLVNGVTYAAQHSNLDADQQADLEMLGGRILCAKGSLFAEAAHRAASVERDQ
jgi:hypothetical protein